MSAATAVTNANLTPSQAIYYETVAIEALFPRLAFLSMTSPKTLPENKGKTIQLYSYPLTPFLANAQAGTNPTVATEGTIGTGLVPTAPKVQGVMGQFVDFVTCSDFLLETAIDATLENIATNMGFRAALIADTVAQQEFDAAVSLDTSAAIAALADGHYVTASILRSAHASLRGRNVRTFEDGYLHGVMHPFVKGDLLNDTTINGLVDVEKRTVEGQALLKDSFAGKGGREVIIFDGVQYLMSTNVPVAQNVITGAATAWAYSTYVAGKDAIFSVKLGAQDIPDEQNFRAKVSTFSESSFDPAGVIKAAVSFNFKEVCSPRADAINAFRRLQSESAQS